MLPNTDMSPHFMGLVVDGLMDLVMYVWHPPADFFAGADDVTKRENLGSRLAWEDKQPGDIECTL